MSSSEPTGIQIAPAASLGPPEALAEAVLPWLATAGSPYFDWLFGDGATTRRVLAAWLMQPGSELHLGRMMLASHARRVVGGYLAMPANELGASRQTDMLTALRVLGRERRAEFLARMKGAHDFVPPVDPQDFFISKLGLAEAARGRGWGRQLLTSCLEDGLRQGFTRFRLNVHVGNEAAVGLYRRLGFREIDHPLRPLGGHVFVGMLRVASGLEDRPHEEPAPLLRIP